MNMGWEQFKGVMNEFAGTYFPKEVFEMFKESGMFETKGTKSCLVLKDWVFCC